MPPFLKNHRIAEVLRMGYMVNKTIGTCLHERANKFSDKEAMGIADWSCSYEELDRTSDLFASHMLAEGLVKGDRIGIWSVNSPNWIITFLAAVKIGVIPFLMNTHYKAMELSDLLDFSELKVLYYGCGCKDLVYEDIIATIRYKSERRERFIHIDEKEPGFWMTSGSFPKSISSKEAVDRLNRAKSRVLPDDTACVMFTSGTTSNPKGVMLSHKSLLTNASSVVKSMRWNSEDRMCLAVPLFHSFGVTVGILASIICGASIEVLPYYKTSSVWAAIENKKCTILNGVPSMFLALVKKDEGIEHDGSGVRSGIIAGSPIKEDEFCEIRKKFVNIHLQPSYGMTETSPALTIADWNEPDAQKANGCGFPLEGVSIRIADAETGSLKKTGEEGEIQAKGYNVMQGYYNQPEETAKVITKDGWLKTGDIGYIDEYNELHVSGRIKDIIIRNGENISPTEIEAAIKKYEGVDEVKVVGIPATIRQEEVVALIQPKKGIELSKEKIFEMLENRLAKYKIPSYIFFVSGFPQTATGKIDIKELKQTATMIIHNSA